MTAARNLPVRKLLTTAEAAEYCGYADATVLRRAVASGRLRSVGKRGGTGTRMFAVEELDRFLAGASVGAGVPSASVPANKDGDTNAEERMETEVELVDPTDIGSGSVRNARRGLPRARTSDGYDDRENGGDPSIVTDGDADSGSSVAGRATRNRSRGRERGVETERALLRIRSLAV